MIKIQKITLLCLFLAASLTYGQIEDNLSKINSLVDKSITDIVTSAEIEDASYNIEVPGNLKILSSRAELNLEKNGLIEQSDSVNTEKNLKYNLESASVAYTDLFRDGLFGDYILERRVSIKGYSILKEKDKSSITSEFSLSATDSINYADLSAYENPSLPFTQSTPPAEPFLSGALEPIIAIGTVVVTLLLFFTVRSN